MKKSCLFLILITVLICGLFTAAAADDDEGTKVLNSVSPTVVRIRVSNEVTIDGKTYTSSWSGTGFFINSTQIVTNHHVVSKPYDEFETRYELASDQESYYLNHYDEFWFTTCEGDTVTVVYSGLIDDTVTGTVVADWPAWDLAVVEIKPSDSKRDPVKLSNGDHIKSGMTTYAIGFPGVFDNDETTSDVAVITKGVLSKIGSFHKGVKRTGTEFTQLLFDTTINPGNSGGPITDKKGNVIGIVTSSSTQGVAYYGVHVDELRNLLDQKGYKYSEATFFDTRILWIGIAVLGAAVAAAAIVMLTRKPKPVPVSPEVSRALVASTVKAISEGRASIEGVSGQFTGQKKYLSMDKDCIFGKLDHCTVRFEVSERTVSREHCRIHYSRTHQRFIIQDLGSSNGTQLVRGRMMRAVPTKTGLALQNGDLIRIPDKSNIFRVNL